MSNNSPSVENNGFDYPLFADNPENPSNEPSTPENRKEIALEAPVNTPKEIVKQELSIKKDRLKK